MALNDAQSNAYQVKIIGPTSGQIVIGDSNIQIRSEPAERLTEAEWDTLQQALDAFRRNIEQNAPPEQLGAALERVEELKDAMTDDEPHLGTMEYIHRWFVRCLPTLAGSVTGFFLNPIVGKLVETAGEIAAAEFRRRVGLI